MLREGSRDQGYPSDRPKFTDVMAELIDPDNMLSRTHVDLKSILGRCSALHGQSLK